MTKIEKNNILTALKFYRDYMQAGLSDMLAHGESEGVDEIRAEINITRTNIVLFEEITDNQPGTITI